MTDEMDKDEIHICNGILFSHKEWDSAICGIMDGPRDHTKWGKPGREWQI